MKQKKFKTKKIWDIQNYLSKKQEKQWFNFNTLIKYTSILISVSIILFFSSKLIKATKTFTKFVWKTAVKTISNQLWENMITDEYWNINVMLIWYWWHNHAWWFLADSIIVASRNTQRKTVTMVSIPRDLYIYDKDLKLKWRINSIFATAYFRLKNFWNLDDNERKHELKMDYASTVMIKKLQKITWLTIPYYALVDFWEFVKLVDNLWWLDINVPKKLYDSAYPQWKKYTIFSINAWLQHINWDIALKYARSRHSTSDFSRSYRQQQIIQAIVDKLLNSWKLNSVKWVKELYNDYKKMVYTNINLKEMIGLLKYKENVKHIFSYVLTTECSFRSVKWMHPWCFLYTPNRDNFWWMSVILPIWWWIWNVSFYDYINKFVFLVAHHQWFLTENAKIWVYNWIDKKYARKIGKRSVWYANKLWVKLKQNWFNIIDVDNADTTYAETSIYLSQNLQNYKDTLEALRLFFSIKNIYTWQNFDNTWIDMKIYLWNNYLDTL